jgi:hypothetical protein
MDGSRQNCKHEATSMTEDVVGLFDLFRSSTSVV